ncbi:MAG: hypothetical protein QOG94_2020 [Solirubrobacteraceae bacterium]|nr:hypothetical protein [Solirubrobacteraceae bacterium]
MPLVKGVAIPVLPSVGLSVATSATATLGATGVLSAGFVGLPTCLLLATTGVPCPFCGLTHAVAELGAGHLSTAIALHPLAPLAALLALAVPVALARRRPLAVPPARRRTLAVPPARRRTLAVPLPPARRLTLTVPAAALWSLAALVLVTWIVRLAL